MYLSNLWPSDTDSIVLQLGDDVIAKQCCADCKQLEDPVHAMLRLACSYVEA